MKFNLLALAHASAAVTGIVYLLCAFFLMVLPDLSMEVAKSWFHGIDISTLGAADITAGSLLTGLITLMAVTWMTAYVFGYAYNALSRK